MCNISNNQFTGRHGEEYRRIVLPNARVIPEWYRGGWLCKYIGVPKADQIKQDEMKDKIRTEYFRQVNRVLRWKLIGGNDRETDIRPRTLAPTRISHGGRLSPTFRASKQQSLYRYWSSACDYGQCRQYVGRIAGTLHDRDCQKEKRRAGNNRQTN